MTLRFYHLLMIMKLIPNIHLVTPKKNYKNKRRKTFLQHIFSYGILKKILQKQEAKNFFVNILCPSFVLQIYRL